MFGTKKRIEELEYKVRGLELEMRMLQNLLIDHKIVINEDEFSWARMLESLKDLKIT